ncbi:MAG TPA: PilN domain-containing protein [Telluria sp.]
MSQQINLFNPIFRKQKKYFSSATMAQALALICVACALLAWDASNRMRSLKLQAAATDARLATRQQYLNEARVQFAPRAKSTTLPAEIKAAEQELALLANASETIKRGGFGEVRGFSGYFRALARQDLEGIWLTDIVIGNDGSSIGLQGNALQGELVPQFMQRLAQEAVMKGKTFSTLEIGPPPLQEAGPGGAPPVAPGYLHFSLQSAPVAPQIAAVAK